MTMGTPEYQNRLRQTSANLTAEARPAAALPAPQRETADLHKRTGVDIEIVRHVVCLEHELSGIREQLADLKNALDTLVLSLYPPKQS